MTIDINGLSHTQVQKHADDTQVKQQSESTVKATGESETGKTSTTDTVSLSDSAVRLGEIGNSVAALPVVDTEKVEAIKQAINDGSYQVDPMKVAEKLMQFESMLKPKA